MFFKPIHYFPKSNTVYSRKKSLPINELKEAFFSLNTNESPGFDDIDLNVIKKYCGEINKHLKHFFDLSKENRIFPEKMEIAKVTPLFKNGELKT